jgi:hypothetical protein
MQAMIFIAMTLFSAKKAGDHTGECSGLYGVETIARRWGVAGPEGVRKKLSLYRPRAQGR